MSSPVPGNTPLLIGNIDPLHPDDTEEQPGLGESPTKGPTAASHDGIVFKPHSAELGNVSSKS